MSGQARNDRSWGRVRDGDGLIRRSAIRCLAQEIAERFEPDRILLFGSYASGQPQPDSDVDLLVVMPARNEIDQALRIEESLDPPFAIDIIVRTPKNLAWRFAEGDWFLREVLEQGVVAPRTHNLLDLLNLLLPHDATLSWLRRGVRSLRRYAVDFRYPGFRATSRQATAAIRHAEQVRAEIRRRLRLPALRPM